MSFVSVKTNIKVWHWNVQSLKNKIDELRNLMTKYKPDIVLIQETWWQKSFQLNVIGYKCETRNRENRMGGGLVTYIKADIPYTRNPVNSKLPEILSIDIYDQNENIPISIINMYHSGNVLNKENWSDLFSSLKNKNTIFAGDLNAKHLAWGSPITDAQGYNLMEALDECALLVLNNGSPTREDRTRNTWSHLDVMFVNGKLVQNGEWRTLDFTMGSDHVLCEAEFHAPQVNVGNNFRSKFNTKKADWAGYQYETENQFRLLNTQEFNVESLYNKFVEILVDVANQFIPKTKDHPRRNATKIWWNDECKLAISDRKKALKAARRSGNLIDFISYKKVRAKCRQVISKAKQIAWQEFCSSLTPRDNNSKVWKVINKMSGRVQVSSLPVIEQDSICYSDPPKTADIIAEKFRHISSLENFSEIHLNSREKTLNKLDNITHVPLVINEEINSAEVRKALHSSKDSAPGSNGIMYSMLKNLGEIGQNILVILFSKIWNEGVLPQDWTKTILIPILKPGKNPKDPSSFRPISLECDVSKTMAKVINNRLKWWLENNEVLSPDQHGFRSHTGTEDALLRISNEIDLALANKQHTIAVFLDLEKAYDKLWIEGFIGKIKNIGLNGNILKYLENSLKNRTIRVAVGDSISNEKIMESGVPQGNPLSPTLFNIMLSDLEISNGNIQIAIYADDIVIWTTGYNLREMVGEAQEALREIEVWLTLWGFSVNPNKTKAMLFSQVKSQPLLYLDMFGENIQFVDEFKYLGVIFTSKLNWKKHFEYIENKCENTLNIVKRTIGNQWGQHGPAVTRLANALIYSKIEYAGCIFTNATKTDRASLERIKNRVSRLILGVKRSTPVHILLDMTNQIPLEMKYKQQLAISLGKAKCKNANSVLNVGQYTWKVGLYKSAKKTPFLKQIRPYQELPSPNNFSVVSPFPSWHFSPITVHEDLSPEKFPPDPSQKKPFFMNIITKLQYYLKIYTDGSKTLEGVGAAFCIPEFQIGKKYNLPKYVNIFTAELFAINRALEWVVDNGPARTVILSDSQSAITTLLNSALDGRPDLVIEIQALLIQARQNNIYVEFGWVPAHCGIEGNEQADKLAKQASENKNAQQILIPPSKSEYRSLIRNRTEDKWRKLWYRDQKGFFYKHLKPTEYKNCSSFKYRNVSSTVNRLRSGHCNTAQYNFKIGKHPSGRCEQCNVKEDVDHLLIHCKKYEGDRRVAIKKSSDIEMNFNLKNLLFSPKMSDILTEFLSTSGIINRF